MSQRVPSLNFKPVVSHLTPCVFVIVLTAVTFLTRLYDSHFWPFHLTYVDVLRPCCLSEFTLKKPPKNEKQLSDEHCYLITTFSGMTL